MTVLSKPDVLKKAKSKYASFKSPEKSQAFNHAIERHNDMGRDAVDNSTGSEWDTEGES